eukprot:15443610-Alexandrium_andersonii.AAC.1
MDGTNEATSTAALAQQLLYEIHLGNYLAHARRVWQQHENQRPSPYRPSRPHLRRLKNLPPVP